MDEETTEDNTLPSGTVVAGRYQIIRHLGAGGMGDVYAAHDTRVGGDCAIKVLKREFSSRRDLVGRFQREARSAASIKHENIVITTDCGQDDTGFYYICSELLEGKELRSHLEDGDLTLPERLEIFTQICSAIIASHAKGIVHRDLKPENIFVTRRRSGVFAKLLDFGIAKVLHETEASVTTTRTGALLGTPEYMSPEQHLARAIDTRTDVFALGVMLQELITGSRPFDGDSVSAVALAIRDRSRTLLEDPQLENIVDAATRWEHAERTASVEELIASVEAYKEAHPDIPWIRAHSLPPSLPSRSIEPPPPEVVLASIVVDQGSSPVRLETMTPHTTDSSGLVPRRFSRALGAITVALIVGVLILALGGHKAPRHVATTVSPITQVVAPTPVVPPTPTIEPVAPLLPPPLVVAEPVAPAPVRRIADNRRHGGRHPHGAGPTPQVPIPAGGCRPDPQTGQNVCD